MKIGAQLLAEISIRAQGRTRTPTSIAISNLNPVAKMNLLLTLVFFEEVEWNAVRTTTVPVRQKLSNLDEIRIKIIVIHYLFYIYFNNVNDMWNPKTIEYR